MHVRFTYCTLVIDWVYFPGSTSSIKLGCDCSSYMFSNIVVILTGIGSVLTCNAMTSSSREVCDAD